MINITVRITTEGFANINDVAHIVELCDAFRKKKDVADVQVAIISNNISGFIKNSLDSCMQSREVDLCDITIDDLYEGDVSPYSTAQAADSITNLTN